MPAVGSVVATVVVSVTVSLELFCGSVARTAKLFAHVSDYVEHEDQGHWVLGQPGWQRVADHAEAWLTGKVH